MKINKSHLAAGLVFALAGFLLISSARIANGDDIRSDRPSRLRDLVSEVARDVAQNQEILAATQQQIEEISNSADGILAQRINKEIQELAAPAGLAPLSGPGLLVTLNDAPVPDPNSPLGLSTNVNDLIIHQEDVQSVVNALWAGGAEGISIMGQRIISTSAVRCVGNTLLLHGKVYSPPFKIEAVGDIDSMRTSLKNDINVAVLQDYVDVFGLVFTVQDVQQVELKPFEGPITISDPAIKVDYR
jgi:uncharacterized protein YlxW (UPF0749 family)